MFHFWLLHLNKSNSLSNQRKEFSSTMRITFDFIIHYVKEIMKSRWNISKKNNNSNFKLDFKNRKSMLQYKIEYEDDNLYNIKFIWQDYIDTIDCSDFIIDFHHRYFKVVESHWTFKKLSDWKLINWTTSIKFDRCINRHDAIEYLKEKKLISTKFTVLSKKKSREVKISTLTISHEELTF